MFWALLCPSSGTQDYLCVITAYDVQCLVAGCQESGAGQLAVRPGRGMSHDSSCNIPLQHIISAINHSVASSWFFFSTHVQRCTDKHTSSLRYLTFPLKKESSLNMGVIVSSTSTNKVLLLKEALIFEVMPYQNPSLCDMQCQACHVYQTLTRTCHWSSEVPISLDRSDV